MKSKKAVIPLIRQAHEAACNAFSILSDALTLCRENDSVDDDTESSIEDLLETADDLQSSLYDLLEGNP